MTGSICTFRKGDIEFALAQTKREGWDSTAELFETCLAHDPDGCFIAEADGQRVGMVTTTRHSRTAWVGNLIVPPEHRGRGIGTHLMTHAMAHLSSQGVRTIRLEADPPGMKLYRRLGFVDEFESLRFQLSPHRVDERCAAAAITPADLPAIAAFDAAYFGDRRDRLLKLLFEQARAAYRLAESGPIRGYALVVPSRAGIRIGPWVTADGQAAESLLQSILAEWSDTTIVLGVPALNRDAIDLLESYGFARTPSCLRMVYGIRDAFGHPENIAAIANGAMG
jgi:ribosomal protein S18 acetylase RimI-like enzyme